MENVGAPPPFFRSFMTSFIRTILAITSATSLIIVIYHCVLIRFCRSRQRETLINNVLPLVNDTSSLQRGVDQKVLEKIPIFPYSLQKHTPQFHDDETECVVCIGELEEGDMVRLLPSCKHAFHVPCIDRWFQEHASCPLCRSPINPPSNDHVSSMDDNENNGNNIEIIVASSQDQDSHVASSSASSSSEVQVQRRRVLRHCVTVTLPIERKSRKRGTIKRSLSLDQYQACGIVIDIEKECHKDLCSSSSSSTKWTIKKFDCASSRFIRSLSLLRGPHSGGVLPY